MAEKVTMMVGSSGLNEGKKEIELVFINGKRIEIAKDEYVEVDPIVKEVYEEARKNAREANIQRKPLELE